MHVQHDNFLMAIQSVAFATLSIMMNFFTAIDRIDTLFVTPVLHGLQIVSLFISMAAGLAVISPDFKGRVDAIVQRFFNRFK